MRRFIPTVCVGMVVGLAFNVETRAATPGEAAPQEKADKTAKVARNTGHDTFAQALAFNRRMLVGVYDKSGKRDPKWDEPARALLEKTAAGFATYRHHALYWSVAQPHDAE